MANLTEVVGSFDAEKVEPNSGFDPMPAGDYEAIIVSSELKETKSQPPGKYLKLELQILSGQFQNRKVWDQLNLVNHGANKEKTEQIAKGTLSAICRAVNVLTPKNSSELHNKPLRITLKIEDDPQYGKKNVVKGYKPRQAGPTTNSLITTQNPSAEWTAPNPNAPAATATPW